MPALRFTVRRLAMLPVAVLILAACGPAPPTAARRAETAPAPSAGGAAAPGGAQAAAPAPKAADRAPGATTPPAPVALVRIQMFSAAAGWGLASGALLRTDDGGAHWAVATPPGASLDAPAGGTVPAYFLDARTAWLLAAGPDAGGTLYRTADGGATWQSATVPFRVARFWFLSGGKAPRGWAMVTDTPQAMDPPLRLYATSDGGSTWEQVSSGPPAAGLLYDWRSAGLAFRPDAGAGWVRLGPALFRTGDGGRTWAPQTLPAADGLAPNMLWWLSFFGGRDGVLAGQVEKKGVIPTLLYITHDGGDTWQPSSTTADDDPLVLSCIDAAHCWSGRRWTGTRDALSATDDGGRTWRELETNLAGVDRIFDLQFVSAQAGFALVRIAGGTALLHTADGGGAWRQVYPAP